jgi:hypothetical protein
MKISKIAKLFFYVFGIILIITLLFSAYGFIIYQTFNGSWEKSGVFGDTFGAINAVFSSLAFLGIVISLIIQREDIRQQQLSNKLQVEQNLLAAKIMASISRQEILAQFLTSEKIHPDFDINANPGDYRRTLKEYLTKTESFLKEAEKLTNYQES